MGHICGTHRMPFSNKYSHLGHTERMRIPASCVPHIMNILESYDTLCGTHGIEKVYDLQEKIEDGIQNCL